MAQTLPETAPHQALYRRFRAQTFAQIVGQQAVVETLRNAVRLNRISHGFLFVGPRGTGKTSMARILAKAVNCTGVADGEPDDTCPSCVAIREGRALDVIELDAASNNRVDDMRELLPRVYTAASDLKRKVFIIDEVQRIKEGWDVLLKTLEEPPEGVLFIFCTTDPSQIRPAVVSRLQRFTFRPLTRAEIEGKLRRILETEGRSMEPDAIALVAELAAGGMRDAESMLDQVLSNADDPITSAQIRDLLGLAEADAVERFIGALATGDALAGIKVLDQLEADGRDVVSFAEQAVGRLRVELMGKLASPGASGAGALTAAARRLTGIDASRSGLGGYRWQLELALLSSVGTPSPAAAASAQPGTEAVSKAPLSSAPASVGTPERVPSTEPVLAPEPVRPAEPVAVPVRRPETHAENGHSSPESAELFSTVRERWTQVIGLTSVANKAVFEHSRPIEVRDGILVLGFPENRAFLREKAEDAKRRQAFESALEQVIGRPMGVRYVVANLDALQPLPASGDDLVAAARRVFGDDLADVTEIS